MPRSRRLAGFAVGSWSLMAGPLEKLTDGDSQRVGDGRDRRGARVDAGPLGAGDRLRKETAPGGDIGKAKPARLPDALDAFHNLTVTISLRHVKSDVFPEAGESPRR